MDPAAIPVFQPMRRIPLPLEEAVAKKITELLKRDIIEPKTGPTSWVSPLVIVGKVTTITLAIGERIRLSKLDIREAFLQVEWRRMRDITTFMTNRGLFRFKRLPFGLVTAPEMFQKSMDEILADCSGTYWYLDDIIIEGKTSRNDNRLAKVLSRLKDRGVELKWEKCQFRVTRLEFLGHKTWKKE
ncbi:uncharacterized protein K02A2.6-like [Armigeres subalbatus]|uniref:uncharacterized protein K02A2.6-like n=1 Tax=Armigeres subalbatus TaxID=124917 RepID=UPI002ED3F941